MPTSTTQAPTDTPSLRDVDAVLLDIDGTLVDSDAAVEGAWTRWAAEYGVGAAALLRTAPGWVGLPWAVVTSADRRLAPARLRAADVEAGRRAGARVAALRGYPADLAIDDPGGGGSRTRTVPA